MKPPHLTRRAALFLAAAPALASRRAPWFEQVDLFGQGDGGVHTYRIPALVEILQHLDAPAVQRIRDFAP